MNCHIYNIIILYSIILPSPQYGINLNVLQALKKDLKSLEFDLK